MKKEGEWTRWLARHVQTAPPPRESSQKRAAICGSAQGGLGGRRQGRAARAGADWAPHEWQAGRAGIGWWRPGRPRLAIRFRTVDLSAHSVGLLRSCSSTARVRVRVYRLPFSASALALYHLSMRPGRSPSPPALLLVLQRSTEFVAPSQL